jgi:hypothetical protein
MNAYSTRTLQVHEKERELAQAWERRHGRAPTSRELLYIANDATLQSRKSKDAAPVDWDALAQLPCARPMPLSSVRPSPATCSAAATRRTPSPR